MPELVLMPAPVMTTTFFAFHIESAISCSRDPESDDTWTVGILKSFTDNRVILILAEMAGPVANWSRGMQARASSPRRPAPTAT